MVESISGGEVAGGSSGFLRGQLTLNNSDILKAPKNIIPTVQAAHAIYWKYRQDHLKRIALYAQIEGLLSGNPPYNPVELSKQGLSHIANFNTLEARSQYERSALSYWNLLNEAETICKFELFLPDVSQAMGWASTMSLEWDRVVRLWPSFTTQVNQLTSQIVKFGLSPVLWTDERDWRWKTIELSRFYVQDQALSDISQLTVVCVESIFTAQYLFEVYTHYKDKKENTPWDPEALSTLLLFYANTWAKNTQMGEFTDLMDLQRRLQNGDLAWDTIFSDGIRLVSMLNQEYDGKITHSIFHRTFTTTEFLYFADRQYECLSDAMMIFTASAGEFTLHSNRGLGHKILSASQAMMRLDCSIVDMSRMASTPLIRGISTGSRDFKAIRFLPGVATDIGTAEFIQNQLGANIEQLVGASQFLSQKIQFNAANSGDDPSSPDRSHGSRTPVETKFRAYREFGILKHNVAHFYEQFDTVIRNMVSKMLRCKPAYPGYEYVKEWEERCIQYGVPPEIMKMIKEPSKFGISKYMDVRATRVAGDGSTLGKIMSLNDLSPLVPSFSARGVREYQKQYVIATQGKEAVYAYLPEMEESDERSGGASLAGVENAIMQAGKSGIVSQDNDHRAHFVTHMAVATNIIEQIQQQQMTPIDAERVFAVLIPHMDEHWQFLASNPLEVEFVQKLQDPWKQVGEYARLNRKNAGEMLKAQIRQQQQEQQQQQDAMTEQQRKDWIAQKEQRRKDIESEEKMERNREQSETRGEIMREKVIKDSDTKRLKVQLEANSDQPEDQTLEQNREQLRDIGGETPAPYDIE